MKRQESDATSRQLLPEQPIRVLVSMLLGLHLLAVVLAAVTPPPIGSPDVGSFLFGDAMRLAGPFYLTPLGLNNDYRFYADEPSPTPLLYCVLHYSDGRREELVVPRKVYASRLRYSRHLALVHHLEAAIPLMEDEPPRDSPEGRQLARERARWARPYAEYIGRRHGAERVELYLRIHLIPFVRDVQRGMSFNDPKLFRDIWIGDFSCGRS